VPTVNTVLGAIAPNEMGGTLSHVHLTLDILCWYAAPQDPELAKRLWEVSEKLTGAHL